MFKRSVMTVFILSIVTITAIASAAGKAVFTDVPTNNELGHAVEQLVEQKIISGYPDNTYRPSQQVTRGQVASLIDRALKLELKHEKKTFKDVNGKSSHAASISRVQQAGIMDGYADGTFKPNDALTRAQMAKVLAIAFDLPKAKTYGFKDVSKDHWAAPHIDSMAAVEITLGSKGNYMPNQAVTRGHYAQFMYRAILWNQDEENSIVKDGVIVQPKPDFKPESESKPQPKPEQKPNGNVVGQNGVTNENKHSPFVPVKKNEYGQILADGKTYNYGVNLQRPLPNEDPNGSVEHWFDDPMGIKFVINGVEREIDDNLYARHFNLERIIPLLGGTYQSINSYEGIFEYEGKTYHLDLKTETLNNQKISISHGFYVSPEVFKMMGIDYYQEIIGNRLSVYMIGGKKLISQINTKSWKDYSNFELKPNGYYAPKSYKTLDLKVAKQTNPKKFNDTGIYEQYSGKTEAFLADSKIQDEKDYVTLGVKYYSEPLKAIHDINSFVAIVPNVDIDERGKMLKTVYELIEKDSKTTKNHQFIKKETYNNYDVYYTVSKGSNFKHLILSFVEKGKNVTVIEY